MLGELDDYIVPITLTKCAGLEEQRQTECQRMQGMNETLESQTKQKWE